MCVDLSQPQEMTTTVETLVDNIRERIESVVSREGNYILKESLRQKSRQRIGESHEDSGDINPILVPVIMIGTKFDKHQV